MDTLAVDAASHDLTFAIASGLDSVQQRVTQSLRLGLDDWYLTPRRGVPFFDDILGSAPDNDIVRRVIEDAIRRVPDVQDIRDMAVTFDYLTRIYSYEATIVAADGAVAIAGSV